MMLCKLDVWEMHSIRGLLERIMGVGIGKNFAGHSEARIASHWFTGALVHVNSCAGTSLGARTIFRT